MIKLSGQPGPQKNYLTRASQFFLASRARHDAENLFFAHDDEIFTIQLDLSTGVLAKQNVIAFLNRERKYLSFVVALAASNGYDFALGGLSLA